MARPFSAPICVYNNFRHPRQVDREAVQLFVYAQWKLEPRGWLGDFWFDVFHALVPGRSYPLPLPDAYPDLWRRLIPFVWHRTESFRVVDVIRTIRNAVLEVREVKDALAVDDHFIAFIDPAGAQRSSPDLAPFLEETLRAGVPLSDLHSALMKSPRCLHSRRHNLLLEGRRGPKRKPQRRAATWGTYLIGWLVGSDTLAATLWNRLSIPESYKWAGGSPARPEAALKKYSEAKSKLIRDLEQWCSRRVVNQEARYATFPPLDPEGAADMERLIALYAQSEARGADLTDYSTRIGYAGRTLFVPLPLDQQPHHVPRPSFVKGLARGPFQNSASQASAKDDPLTPRMWTVCLTPEH